MQVFTRTEEILLTVIYAITAASAIILNSFICYLIWAGKVKSTAFTLMLLNLSISDIGSALGLCPYIFIGDSMVSQFDISNETAGYICSITTGQLPFWICSGVSVLNLCLISFNRYLSVNHPRRFTALRRPRAVKLSILLLWIFAIITIIPNLFTFRFDYKLLHCTRVWPKIINARAYALTTTAVGIGLPVLCMLYTFAATVRTLWFKQPKLQCRTSAIRVRKRVILLLGALIFTFLLCWSPFSIYWIASGSGKIFSNDSDGFHIKQKIVRIVLLLAFCNAVLNPIIYGLRGKEFRKAVSTYIFPRARENVSSTNPNAAETAGRQQTVHQFGARNGAKESVQF